MEATDPVQAPAGAAAEAPRPVFEIEGLHIDYVTELGVLHAVRDVSLTINEHESFGLVGESGSGKSTLPSVTLPLEAR
jgi:ABC-type glutathione transport system ATPase component